MTIQPDSPTNTERSERVRNVIESYNDDDLTSNIIDLLTDLQHYCNIAHAYDISHRTFDDLLETARAHFDAEINGRD